MTRLSLFDIPSTTFRDHPLIQVDVNKGRRGAGVGRSAEGEGREGNSLHARYKRKGKEREGKAQNEKSLEDFLSPQSSLHFPSFSPPQFNASHRQGECQL